MKKIISFGLVGLLGLFGACSANTNAEKEGQEEKLDKVVVGSMNTDAEIWEFIAKSDLAKEANLEIEVKAIDGGPQLNSATVDGSVGVNAFQSLGYLVSFNKDSKEKLVPIATTYMEPMGIYSDKYESLDEVKDGGLVALADNPSNTARGLRLLEDAGLITLSDTFDNGTGTPSDIVDNPKQLEFTLIDDTTGPRILQDVDLALISNSIAFDSGLNVLSDSLYKEVINQNTKTSINVLATTEQNKDNEVINKLAALYHSQEVADYIKENFGGTKVDVQEDIDSLWDSVQ